MGDGSGAANTCKNSFLVDWFGTSAPVLAGILALVAVAAFYIFAGVARRDAGNGQGKWLDPLVITVGVFGRASLSNLQVFYFSLIVFWIVTYYLLRCGELSGLSVDVLYLLGIGAAGTAGAKVTVTVRRRLSYQNWAWLKRQNWIVKDIGRERRPPQWSDLVTSEDSFDVSKFQTLFVSLLVGAALLVAAIGQDPSVTENFTIPPELLGLLGLSQTINVGNKAIAPSPIAELNLQLDKVRDLEAKFVAAVATKWDATPPSSRDLATAKSAAPAEYRAFKDAVGDAATMVEERIRKQPAEVEPDIPA